MILKKKGFNLWVCPDRSKCETYAAAFSNTILTITTLLLHLVTQFYCLCQGYYTNIPVTHISTELHNPIAPGAHDMRERRRHL
jgi:hypothetical protein